MASIARPDAKLPPPPPSLPKLRTSDIRTVPAGSLCWRVYRAGGEHRSSWNELRRYGPTASGRFDHHEPPPHDDPARAIVYVARDATAAVAEAFQDTRTIDRRRQEPWLVAFELTADIAALDLMRLWPTRAGASQAIATGRRVTAQAWSRAIYGAYPDVAALAYRSSMAGSSMNLALFERAAAGIPASPVVHLPLTHPGLALPLARLASKLGYGLR
jgi:RES domain-containing protein